MDIVWIEKTMDRVDTLTDTMKLKSIQVVYSNFNLLLSDAVGFFDHLAYTDRIVVLARPWAETSVLPIQMFQEVLTQVNYDWLIWNYSDKYINPLHSLKGSQLSAFCP